MTETPQDFDFDAWLEGAERPQRSVTVYQKAGLIADLDRLEEQINNADDDAEVDGPSMAGGVGKLRAEYARVAQAFKDSALVIRVQGLREDEQRDIIKANGSDPATAGAHVLAAAIVSPKVTAEQVVKLEKVIGDPQFARITTAYYGASKDYPAVSADFLPKHSTPDDGGE